MSILRTAFLSSLLLSLATTAARAEVEVKVDVRLEKTRFLAGEPVFALIDVRNVGDQAVGLSRCDVHVKLAAAGVAPRELPNIFGCGMGMGSGFGCGGSHPPLLQPGATTTYRLLLKDYDLKPGSYQIMASGTVDVRWTYSPLDTPGVEGLPPHSVAGPVTGSRVEQQIPLQVVAASEDELQAAFAPLVSDATGTVWQRRGDARQAIIETAPPFLESLIARLAAEGDSSAFIALTRIATPAARAQLKSSFGTAQSDSKAEAMLALARIAHRDDFEFLATALDTTTLDDRARGYAALGLARIGGEPAVRRLERALPTTSSALRHSVIRALGNSRSRAAVPILLAIYGNNPDQYPVCEAMRTLTHRAPCDDSAPDPASQRRQWLRWWRENAATAPIYGPTECLP